MAIHGFHHENLDNTKKCVVEVFYIDLGFFCNEYIYMDSFLRCNSSL